MVSEPISPELVLVDPELARRERERPAQHASSKALADAVVGRQKALPQATLPREMPPPLRRRRRFFRGRLNRFLLFTLCLISLMGLGGLLALTLPGERGERRTLALPRATAPTESIGSVARSGSRSASHPPGSSTAAQRQEATTRSRGPRSPLTPVHAAKRAKLREAPPPKRGTETHSPSALPVETHSTVERKLLALVVRSPAGKLPPKLIDRTTGLAKNNLQAICGRTSNSRSFLCVVKSAVRPSDGRVYVSYQPTHDGRGRFTWSRHRSG